MDTIMSKICLSLLICSLLSTKEVYSQSCSWPPPGASGDFTNGPSAELITANDGVSLLGIRVLWTIKSEYLNCQFSSLRVQLNSGERTKDITVNDSSANFDNLDCNRQYTPKVRGASGGIGSSDIGNSVFFESTITSAPSQLSRVCFGPTTANKQNISWDLLPCHLQNGADITGYIIQYNRASCGVAQNISSSDSSQVDCGVESGSRYRCLLSSSLFTHQVPYSFQVAAVNRYGVGPFSGQVIGMISGKTDLDASNCYTITQTTEASHDKTTEKILSFTTSHSYENNTLTTAVTSGDGRLNSTSPTAWIIVAGSLFVIVIILVGVIIMSVTLNCILWKKLKFTNISKTNQTNTKLEESEIDMKECSAYGHVMSTKTTSADEQYVYESTK